MEARRATGCPPPELGRNVNYDLITQKLDHAMSLSCHHTNQSGWYELGIQETSGLHYWELNWEWPSLAIEETSYYADIAQFVKLDEIRDTWKRVGGRETLPRNWIAV